jgi:hypothetical protein
MKMASQAIVRPSVISVLGLICAAQFVLQLDFSIAGGLLTTGQQIGAAVGIALRATLSAARTVQAGSLASGYGFSYLVALGLVLLAIVLVATQLNHRHARPNWHVNVRKQSRPGLMLRRLRN